MGGLKKVLRKVGPLVAAGAAIAAGQPQLAVAAAGTVSAATKKKPKIQPPVEAIAPAGILGDLPQADRNFLLIGGAVVGTLLLTKLIGRRP
jgi:hypothetical protein